MTTTTKTTRCKYCGETITDGREIAGATDAAWMTLDGDFGCDRSPDTTDECCGDHAPITVPQVPEQYDAVLAIMQYEQGELGIEDTLVLFQHLLNTGMCWTLQGHYGRTATALIDGGWIFEKQTTTQEAM